MKLSTERFKIRAFSPRSPGAFSGYHFLWSSFGAWWYHYASEKIFVIGVTGTKGKTTTLELLNAILESAGKRTALLGSYRMKIGAESGKNALGNSMPGRGYIQKFLRQAVAAGCNYALIEVTSQGVVAHRHRFVNWNVGRDDEPRAGAYRIAWLVRKISRCETVILEICAQKRWHGFFESRRRALRIF